MNPVRSERRASALVLALVLATVGGILLFALDWSVGADSLAAAHMVREIRATAVAESVLASIDAAALSRTWALRPWTDQRQSELPGMGRPLAVKPLALQLSPSRVERQWIPADCSWRATVEDLDEASRSYLVRLEITLEGVAFAFAASRQLDRELFEDRPRGVHGLLRRETPGLGGQTAQLVLEKLTADAAAPGPGPLDAQTLATLSQLDADLRLDATAETLPLAAGRLPVPPLELPLDTVPPPTPASTPVPSTPPSLPPVPTSLPKLSCNFPPSGGPLPPGRYYCNVSGHSHSYSSQPGPRTPPPPPTIPPVRPPPPPGPPPICLKPCCRGYGFCTFCGHNHIRPGTVKTIRNP